MTLCLRTGSWPEIQSMDGSDTNRLEGDATSIGRQGCVDLVNMVTLLLAIAIGQNEVVVGPNGSDRNPGTSALPVATLDAARDRARAIKCHAIVVEAGEFRFDHSLQLDARDDGLTIKAAGGGRPKLLGGILLSGAKPCNDDQLLARIIDPAARGLVQSVDLRALGISHLAPIQSRGFPQPPRAAPSELFADRSPMTLARWPNEGYAKIGQVIEAGNGENDRDKPPRKPIFLATDSRPMKWANAEDLWLYGYWKYDWADESIHAQGVDATSGAITLDRPHTYGVDKGVPFYAENLIEELDRPGEYWIDRTRGMLYVIPGQAGAKRLELSTLAEPLVSISDAKHVTLRGLDFCVSRGDGIQVKTGDAVRIEGCRMFALGGRGAVIDGGRNSGLQSCDIWDTGEGGVSLSGGDRRSLTPAHNFVDNCDIHDYQRRSQTYRPAVLISGVGNRVSHCAIHDAPHSAIIFSGNDHVIENNEFYRTILRTGDGGVVYTGRDWTARGTEIRFNYFHDNIGLNKWEPAIYIDDLGSGIHMHGNTIERCHWGFLIGGGRDNVIEDNTLIDCHLAFDCDARGMGWAKTSLPTMTERLAAVPYKDEPWRSRYPALVSILDHEPLAPSGNVLRRNILVRSGRVEQRMEDGFKKTAVIVGNVEALVAPTMRSGMGVRMDVLRASLKAPM